MTAIAAALNNVLLEIRTAEKTFHRPPCSVRLLAVSKGQSVENISIAFLAGQTAFGESYLQEALKKIPLLHNAEWHFIGPIQSNKTRKIAEHFSWVHSVAEQKIAKRLSDQRPPHLPPLNICLAVNISEEPSKSGILPCQAKDLAAYCAALPSLRLRGLMAIPAPHPAFAEQSAEFHKLRLLFDELCKEKIILDTLSMGMSHDFNAAISEGATIVRIGTAIFGERQK